MKLLIRRFLAVIFLFYCAIVFLALMLLVLPFVLILAFLFRGKAAQDRIFIVLRFWARAFSLLCFFPVSVSRRPEQQAACIYVCNHTSYLDSVCIVLAVPDSFKPLGKVEMLKVPVFGLIYKRVVIMIDRKSKESRAQSILELKQELARGQSIFIFPEGTMNRGSEPLTAFYDGAFRIALETGTPIQPMVLLHARERLPRANPLQVRPGPIHCIFDELIYPAPGDSLEQLKAKVFQRMEALIAPSLRT